MQTLASEPTAPVAPTLPDPARIAAVVQVMAEHRLTFRSDPIIRYVCLDCGDVVHDTGLTDVMGVSDDEYRTLTRAGYEHIATHIIVDLDNPTETPGD